MHSILFSLSPCWINIVIFTFFWRFHRLLTNRPKHGRKTLRLLAEGTSSFKLLTTNLSPFLRLVVKGEYLRNGSDGCWRISGGSGIANSQLDGKKGILRGIAWHTLWKPMIRVRVSLCAQWDNFHRCLLCKGRYSENCSFGKHVPLFDYIWEKV